MPAKINHVISSKSLSYPRNTFTLTILIVLMAQVNIYPHTVAPYKQLSLHNLHWNHSQNQISKAHGKDGSAITCYHKLPMVQLKDNLKHAGRTHATFGHNTHVNHPILTCVRRNACQNQFCKRQHLELVS